MDLILNGKKLLKLNSFKSYNFVQMMLPKSDHIIIHTSPSFKRVHLLYTVATPLHSCTVPSSQL